MLRRRKRVRFCGYRLAAPLAFGGLILTGVRVIYEMHIAHTVFQIGWKWIRELLGGH
jgi:hypothetical protein